LCSEGDRRYVLLQETLYSQKITGHDTTDISKFKHDTFDFPATDRRRSWPPSDQVYHVATSHTAIAVVQYSRRSKMQRVVPGRGAGSDRRRHVNGTSRQRTHLKNIYYSRRSDMIGFLLTDNSQNSLKYRN